MNREKISPFILYGLVVIACCGCYRTGHETHLRTIESDAIQEFIKNPSGSQLPLKVGQTVVIFTKTPIQISSWNVSTIKLVVNNVDTTGITGKVVFVCCDSAVDKENVAGNVIKVKLQDVDSIKVWKIHYQLYDLNF